MPDIKLHLTIKSVYSLQKTFVYLSWLNSTVVGASQLLVVSRSNGCKLLNGQTETMLRSKRLVLVVLTSYQETLKSSFIIPFCLLKLESLDCMNSFLYVKLCRLIVYVMDL